jgi:hypothetical protein
MKSNKAAWGVFFGMVVSGSALLFIVERPCEPKAQASVQTPVPDKDATVPALATAATILNVGEFPIVTANPPAKKANRAPARPESDAAHMARLMQGKLACGSARESWGTGEATQHGTISAGYVADCTISTK